MFQRIEQLLKEFRSCFSRKAAFGWFVTVIVGFMLRSDRLGVTSAIRDLSLAPRCYEPLIHFFHSTAWEPDTIRQTWWKLLAGPDLSRKETLYPDRRWRQTVKGSILYGRC